MLASQGQSFATSLKATAGDRLNFLWINAGSFMMGSPEGEIGRDESERQFLATLSQGFWLSSNLVTQGQWQTVMGGNPSRFQQDGDDRPVENIDWHEAMEFCKRLRSISNILLPNNYEFSLPTETQWEYACRAGTTTSYFFGGTTPGIDRYVWHSGNSSGETHSVGLKESNPWGFYDLCGNVYEWCYDWFAEYPRSETIDWIGCKQDDLRFNYHSVRGGGYCSVVEEGTFRSSCRSQWRSVTKRPWCGFRVSIRHVVA